jgi:hypothetical protein
MKTGVLFVAFGCSTDQNAQEKKQHASLRSSGWMNGDEDEGSVRCFWVLNRPECTRENNMQAFLVLDG